MKIKVQHVALLAALGLTAASCQKNNEFSVIGSEQVTETIHVVYSINGEVFQAVLGESEWDSFIERMLALARDGYEVSFSKNRSSLTSQSKEQVTFVTTSEQEAHAWSNDMVNQGYYVTISYNKKTGEYTCIAIK